MEQIRLPSMEEEMPLVPARMLNEYAYCPRLAYLEWVQGEFTDSVDTVEGRFRHQRVDQPGGIVPPAVVGQTEVPSGESIHARSVLIASERLAAIARVDLVEGDAGEVVPVDYKKGEMPSNPLGAWEPELAQVCMQGLLLRDHDYNCRYGIIYYIASKRRVTVELTPELIARTLELLDGFKETVASGKIPPPMEDSHKCVRCSLAGICLPDEVNFLAQSEETGEIGSSSGSTQAIRRLYPARDDAMPVYIQAQGVSVGKEGGVLKIKNRGETVQEVRLMDVSQLNILGNIQLSTQAIRELCAREIPICYYTYGGRFYGLTSGMAHKNIELRRLQFHVAEDGKQSLGLAKGFVKAKILNCRTLVRRNHISIPARVLQEMSHLAEKAATARSAETLLGIEGTAARLYFENFAGMLKPKLTEAGVLFDFNERNRRPPKDPVNALLSFAYALLAKELTVTLLAVGFDPYLGFFHRPRYGRPALALDIMEEFRPLIADSVVLGLINNGEIGEGDFITSAGAVAMTDAARRRFLEAYERRMDTLIIHPVFGYKVNYRRILEVQARLLARHLMGEIDRYPSFRTR